MPRILPRDVPNTSAQGPGVARNSAEGAVSNVTAKNGSTVRGKEALMPADLLGDVAHTSSPMPAPRFSMLPLSIAGHVSVAVVLLLIPLAAEVDLPTPMPRTVADYMAARPVPAPSPPPRAARPGARHAAGAPVAAPMAITTPSDEPDVPAAPTGLAVEGGLGSGSGFRAALGEPVAVEAPTPMALPLPPPAPVRPGGVIREPRKIFDVAPVYPALARSGGVEGVVILEAVINVRGEVERLRVLRSVPLLDASAIAAVQRWRYTPTLLNGSPVPVLITVTVRFALR